MNNIIFDYSKLLGKIKEKYDTQVNFVKDIDLSLSSLNQRLNNKIDFTTRDIKTICEKLDINKSEIPDYFFTEKV